MSVTTTAPSDVRTWALANGLTSARRGPLPRAVLEAYSHAHPGTSAGAGGRPPTPGSLGPGAGEGPVARDTPAPSRAPRAGGTAPPPAGLVEPGRPAAPALRRQGTAGPGPGTSPRQDELERRLLRVEAQLTEALDRLEELETRTSRSLLGLRLTL